VKTSPTLVTMMLEGPGSFNTDENQTAAALSIAQLIVFNAVKTAQAYEAPCVPAHRSFK